MAEAAQTPVDILAGSEVTYARTGISEEGAEVSRDLGTVTTRKTRSGAKARIQIKRAGRRYSIGKLPVGRDTWIPLTPDTATQVLAEIRNRFGEYVAQEKMPEAAALERAVAPFLEVGVVDRSVLGKLRSFLEFEKRRLGMGQIRSRTFTELRQKLDREGGYFAYWSDWQIDAVSYGALEDWTVWLSEEHTIGGRTINHALDDLKRCMKWLSRRGHIHGVPEFPRMKVVRKDPDVLWPAQVAAVFDAIEDPWDLGIFLALYRAIRPSEARGMREESWDGEIELVARGGTERVQADRSQAGESLMAREQAGLS